MTDFLTKLGCATLLAFTILGIQSCSGSSTKLSPVGESLVHVDSDLSSETGVVRASLQQYQSALQAMENQDWLEAQYYLDLALTELMSEQDDTLSTRADSLYIQSTLNAVVHALEKVYPQVALLGSPDSTQGYLDDLPTGDELEEVFNAQDSAEILEIRKFLDTLNLAQFSLPVVLNERVLREIHFLSHSVRTFTEGSLSRKTQFESMIRAKLRERNMPEDLIHLALVESGFKTKAYSRAKASGLWQFIPATGKRYGLTVDFWVDMRRNPDMSTEAALDYLQDLYREFKDWNLAMAAYNCGEGRVRRLVREAGGSASYWDLALPRETMHYVPRILAATIIARHPEQYGFKPEIQDTIPYDTVTVKDCVPLVNVAEAAGVALNTVRDLNWELNRWCTPPNSRSFRLRIPAGTRDRFVESYAKMDKSKFARWHNHRVRSGENLGVIARNYGLSVAELRDVNGLKSNLIRVGQNLLIPMPSGAVPPRGSDPDEVVKPVRASAKISPAEGAGTYKVKKGDNLGAIARRFGVSIQDVQRWNSLSNDRLTLGQVIYVRPPQSRPSTQNLTSPVVVGALTHTVQSGETYYSIANSYGVSVDDLMTANQAANSRLNLGQVLKLPAQAKKSASTVVTMAMPSNAGKAPAEGEVWYSVQSGDNLAAIARRYDASISDLLKWNSLDMSSTLKIGQRLRVKVARSGQGPTGIFYLVQKGDTLWDIAKRYGVSIQQIMEWNSLSDGKVQPGTRLKVGL